MRPSARRGLYYPFHLCHEATLQRLLAEYDSVHFRDYMALQFTPLSGTTAYQDRMGAQHPDLVATGRIVQGYSVSGPMDARLSTAVDRDLADQLWRDLFHHALIEDRRFQRGLFDLSHAVRIGGSLIPGAAALLRLIEARRTTHPYSLRTLQELSHRTLTTEDGYDFDYTVALVKTSASLIYTFRLATQHGLEAVTDSEPHFLLLRRTCDREGFTLSNQLMPRQGY